MGYKTYPEYKDSGAQWLGEVPAHWETRRLKYAAPLRNIKIVAGESHLPYVGLENIESWSGKYLVQDEANDSEGLSSRFYPGDVLFGKLRPYLAKAFLANFEGACSSELLVLQGKGVQPEFLVRFVLSVGFIREVDSSTYGTKMPRASWDFIGNLLVTLPPTGEQATIAAFLDEKTAQIDQLIEKKTRFIELLKEKRAALITEAVTGKFDVRTGKPYAEYKDSGVEWLGEVPAHWKVKRLKFLIRCLDGKRIPLNSEQRADIKGNIPYWGSGGIVDYINQYLFDEELILLGEDGAPFFDRYRAVAYLASGKIWVNNHIHVLRNISDIPSVWIVHALNCVEYRSYIGGSTRDKLTQDDMKEIALPVPSSFIEIKSILGFLDRQTARIDKLIDKTQLSIDLLKEKRAALITAAVTGKIDVRNWNTEAA